MGGKGYKRAYLDLKAQLEALQGGSEGQEGGVNPPQLEGKAEKFADFVARFPYGQVTEAAIYIYLAKMSGDAGLHHLWGPIALKLATTPTYGESLNLMTLAGVDIPVNSQVVGIAMLGVLGLAPMINQLKAAAEPQQKSAFENMTDCDAKRNLANAQKYMGGLLIPEYEGWYDPNPGEFGAKYLECKASSAQQGGGSSAR